jgi:hypothetical protein
VYYEIRILSGRYAGRVWTYDDEDDARAALATLDADTEAELLTRRWFGGAWLTTRMS